MSKTGPPHDKPHEPTTSGKHGLWGMKGTQLPAYIQHVVNDLKPKHGERAYAMAVGIVRNWSQGHDGRGNKVSSDTQAAAVKAMTEWKALRAKAKVTKGNPYHDPKDGKFTFANRNIGATFDEHPHARQFDMVMDDESLGYDISQKRTAAARYGESVMARLSSGQPVATAEIVRLGRVYEFLTGNKAEPRPERRKKNPGAEPVSVQRDAGGNALGNKGVQKGNDMAEEVEFTMRVPIKKVDTERRMAFGWASVAKVNGEFVVDHQGDRISKIEDMEDAAYDFVLHSRDGSDNHVRKGVATLVESMAFTPEKWEAMGFGREGSSLEDVNPDTLPVAWWVGYRIDDDDVLAKVKSGKYKMFSVEGIGKRTPIQE